MKALILNSGTGTRMGKVSDSKPKCMTDIVTGETILSRQLRQLSHAGVKETIITTGAYDDVIRAYCHQFSLANPALSMNFSFVKNEIFHETNYIYSMYLASPLVDEDFILLHGDLVFQDEVLLDLVKQEKSTMTVSSTAPIPQKDFKVVINNDVIVKIGVDLFSNAIAAQPMYKLKYNDWCLWRDNIEKFCNEGNRRCYAEDALVDMADPFLLFPIDVKDYICSEVDDMEDLRNVNAQLISAELDKR